MTPAMKADAADALLRVELKELGEKLIQLAATDTDNSHIVAMNTIDRARARFLVMVKEIDEQSAEAKKVRTDA